MKLEKQTMKKTKINIDTLERKFAYNAFLNHDNPFTSIVCNMDITNLVKHTKENGNFYHSMCYLAMKAMNQVKNFGYRIINDELYLLEEYGINPVGKDENNEIYFYDIPYTNTLEEFLRKAEENKNFVLTGNSPAGEDGAQSIYASCFPWRKMSALNVPINKKQCNPQVIWDKFETVNGKTTINIFVFAHHSFCDGFHIAQFFDAVEKLEKEFPNI